MEKHVFKGKPWRAQTFVVLALLAACLTFFLVYVPNQKASFIEHNLRILGDMGDQIQEAIANLHTSIINSTDQLKAISDNTPKNQGSQPAGTNAVTNATSLDTNSAPVTNSFQEIAKAFTNSIDQIQPRLKMLKWPDEAYLGGGFSCTNIEIRPGFKVYALHYDYKEQQSSSSFAVEADVKELLGQILSRPEFKDVLLLHTNKRVEFQRSQIELRSTNYLIGPDLLMTVLPSMRGDVGTNQVVTSAGVGEVEIAGEPYKVFFRPLVVSLGTTSESARNWILCGLVPGKDFTLATWKMPQITIVVMVFLAIGALLLLPFLNVALAVPLAALRRSDVVMVLSASVCLCVALAFGWFFLYAQVSSEDNLDEQVGAICSNVCANVKYELLKADHLLTSLDRELFINATNADSFRDILTTWKNIKERGAVFSRVPALFSNIPFSDVSWINSNGMQVAKWTPSPPIGLINVKDRDYFQSLKQGWAWSAYEVFDSPSANFVYLDSIFSKTRNENTAILSHRFQCPGEWPTNEVHNRDFYFTAPIISTITFQPSSLFNVILPRGYGFCLLDPNGRVLFHSDPTRNLRENFVVEAGHSSRLLSDIRSRTEDEFDCEYLNQPCHLAVRPMAGTTLTAVAFRNEDILGKLHGNILLNAVSLLLLYGLLLLLAFGLLVLFIRILNLQVTIDFSWLWPQRRHDFRYANSLLIAAPLAIACFIGVLCSLSPNGLLVWAGLGPLITLGLSWLPWVFKKNAEDKKNGEDKKNADDPPEGKLEKFLNRRLHSGPTLQYRDAEIGNRAAHLLWLGLALFLLAFVPAVACYKLAFGKESELLIRGTQLQLARDISQRRVTIRVAEPRYAGEPRGWEYWRYALDYHLTSSLSHYETNVWNTSARAASENAPDDFGAGAAGRRDAGWFAHFYQKHRWPLEEAGFRSSGLLSNNASDFSWRSDFRTNTLSLLVQGVDDNKRPGKLLVQSQIPQLGWMTSHRMPTIAWDWHALAFVALLIAIAVPFCLAWFIGKRVLLFEVSRDLAPSPKDPKELMAVWKHCTPEEKLTLYQLAETGFVPSGRNEVKPLLKKGLLSFKPNLCMEPQLVEIVRQNAHDSEIQKSLQTAETKAPSWFTLRTALGITITAVAIFLFITQQEFWHLAVGFASAFATAAQDFSHVKSALVKDKSKTEPT